VYLSVLCRIYFILFYFWIGMRRGKEMNWKIGDELDQVCQTTLSTETQHNSLGERLPPSPAIPEEL